MYRGWGQTDYQSRHCAIDQKNEGTLDDRGRDGLTKFTLRIKEQATHLTPFLIMMMMMMIFVFKRTEPLHYHSTNPAQSTSYSYFSFQTDKRAKRDDLQTKKTFSDVGKHWTEEYVHAVFRQCSERRRVHFLRRKVELCILSY